jgi:hypothetical protein
LVNVTKYAVPFTNVGVGKPLIVKFPAIPVSSVVKLFENVKLGFFGESFLETSGE